MKALNAPNARDRLRIVFPLALRGTNIPPSQAMGPKWLAPRGILPGRLVKIGTQVDF
jgi:hypothetical protein